MKNLKKKARIAGWLYLVIIVCAGFSEGFIRAQIIDPADATQTLTNIMEQELLFRSSIVLDLIAFICDIGVSIILYLLLKPVSKTLSLVAALFRIIAHPIIGSFNLLNQLAAVLLISNPEYINSLGSEGLSTLVSIFMEIHSNGYLIAGLFFGVHCFILGYLILKSVYFPKVLGFLLMLASIGYLTESLGNFLLPGPTELLYLVVLIPAIVAEFYLCIWLIIGCKNQIGFLDSNNQSKVILR